MNITKSKYLILILFLIFPLFLNSQTQKSRSLSDNPTQLKKYVVDETNTLSSTEINSLMKKLVDFDKETTNQFVVYMISSLEGEPIEEVSIRIAEGNKIGRKDRDNGILLLVAKNDREIRIEVGYGLEGAFPDGLADKIIRKEIIPSFKAGNFYEGIDKGVDAVIAATKDEYTADEETETSGGPSLGCCFGLPIFVVIIFGFIFLMIVISVLQRIFGFGRGMHSGSGRSGSSGWSNWGSGSGWSSGSGSSGSSFGGFSGGGGSFGGGGASGSW